MVKELLVKLKTFLIEAKRVHRITRKPNKQEFKTIVKIPAIGIAVIGVIGFIINTIASAS